MKEKIIAAIRANAVGNIELHKTNIEIYFNNPAGIGEHSDILEAIQGELDKLTVHADRLAALELFNDEPDASQLN